MNWKRFCCGLRSSWQRNRKMLPIQIADNAGYFQEKCRLSTTIRQCKPPVMRTSHYRRFDFLHRENSDCDGSLKFITAVSVRNFFSVKYRKWYGILRSPRRNTPGGSTAEGTLPGAIHSLIRLGAYSRESYQSKKRLLIHRQWPTSHEAAHTLHTGTVLIGGAIMDPGR